MEGGIISGSSSVVSLSIQHADDDNIVAAGEIVDGVTTTKTLPKK
jgi:hypothetical protein